VSDRKTARGAVPAERGPTRSEGWRIDDATPADVRALADLLALLFEQEAEFAPDRTRQLRGLAQIVGDPELGRILVLRPVDAAKAPAGAAAPAGMVNLLFTVSTALGERVCLLEDMVVAPAWRAKGAGTRLLEAAIACARAEGCVRITLLTDGNNAAAQRFYGRAGFVRSSMTAMRLALP